MMMMMGGNDFSFTTSKHVPNVNFMQIMLLKFRYRLCDCHDQCIDIPVLWQLNRLNVSLHIWMKCRENTTASGIPEHGLFCYFYFLFFIEGNTAQGHLMALY